MRTQYIVPQTARGSQDASLAPQWRGLGVLSYPFARIAAIISPCADPSATTIINMRRAGAAASVPKTVTRRHKCPRASNFSRRWASLQLLLHAQSKLKKPMFRLNQHRSRLNQCTLANTNKIFAAPSMARTGSGQPVWAVPSRGALFERGLA